MTEELLLTPEEIHNMEQLIISAMTSDGEYPVENVGEHAEQIAKVLIFNSFRQLAKVQRLRLDRPDRKEIALIIGGYSQRDLMNIDEVEWRQLKNKADQILALLPTEEEIRRDERTRIWGMLWEAVDETDEDFPTNWVDDNCGSKACISHHKLCLLWQALKEDTE